MEKTLLISLVSPQRHLGHTKPLHKYSLDPKRSERLREDLFLISLVRILGSLINKKQLTKQFSCFSWNVNQTNAYQLHKVGCISNKCFHYLISSCLYLYGSLAFPVLNVLIRYSKAVKSNRTPEINACQNSLGWR